MMNFLFQAPIAIPLKQEVTNAKVSPIVNLGLFVSRLVGVMLLVAGALTFVYLVYGGIKWIMANGDSGKLEEAKATLTNAIMGLAVTAAAWAVFLLINYFLGLGIVGGVGAGSGGGGEGTAVCTPNTTGSDGGAGNYCLDGGAAQMKCVGAGEGPSGFNYAHWEPICCTNNQPRPGYTWWGGGDGNCN